MCNNKSRNVKKILVDENMTRPHIGFSFRNGISSFLFKCETRHFDE